jgi:hypothetical protein
LNGLVFAQSSTTESTPQETEMKNWMNRFAILTVLGAVLGSALVMGCGGGDTETTTNSANGTTSQTTTDD